MNARVTSRKSLNAKKICKTPSMIDTSFPGGYQISPYFRCPMNLRIALIASSILLLFASFAHADLRRAISVEECIEIRCEELSLFPYNSDNVGQIERLTWLVALDLSSTEVTDLSGLDALQELRTLMISYTDVENIDVVARLLKLEKISIAGTKITSFEALAGHPELKEIYAPDVNVSDLAPLATLPKLEQILMSNAELSDLSSLAEVSSLRSLYFMPSTISDLSPLSNLPNLRSLNIYSPHLTDLTALASTRALESLSLRCGEVVDINPLNGLPNLRRLDLTSTKLSKLKDGFNLPSLEVAMLSGTQITSLEFLKKSDELWYIDVSDNARVELQSFPSFNNLKQVVLDEEVAKASKEYITKLEKRGIEFTNP